MAWINNITRSAVDGALYCNTQDLDGAFKTLPVHEIPPILERIQGESGIKAILDSSRHSLDNVAMYLDRLRWSAVSPLGQSLHRFQTPDGEIWMPSQLLVKSMLCSNRRLNQFLFTPKPLTMQCHPVQNTCGREIELYTNELQRTRWATKLGTVERLTWLTHSRSALRAWSSTYRNALDGRIDCTMPDGSFEYRLRGVRVRGVLCVTAAMLVNVSCSDIYTSGAAREQTYQINGDVARRESQLQSRRKAVEALHDRLAVTETQVARVREILYPTPPMNSCDVRPKVVNNLNETLRLTKIKFLTECRWSELPASEEEITLAKSRRASMRVRGTWERVKAVLLEQ